MWRFRHALEAQRVALDVAVVGQDVDGIRRAVLDHGRRVILCHGIVVHARHRHRHRRRVRPPAPVADRVVEGVDPGVVGVGRVLDLVAGDGRRPVRRVRHAVEGQRVVLGVAVVGQHVDGIRRAVLRHRRRVILRHGIVVHARHCHRHRRRVRPAIPVADRVVEGVEPGVVGIGRVLDPVAGDGRRTVRRVRHAVDSERIALDVAVVGQDVDGIRRAVLDHGRRVILWHGIVVHGRHGHGHRRRVRPPVPVADRVVEGVEPGVVGVGCVHDLVADDGR